jgi:hypothetical protein
MPTGIYKRTAEATANRMASLISGGKLKGKTPWNKGKPGSQVPWNKGKKGSQVAWNKGIKYLQISGAKHGNWQGGINPVNDTIRKSIESRLWRESVFARDNWTCQQCEIRGAVLHAHHIKRFKDYPELRFAIDNGKTLCKPCHIKAHKKVILTAAA